MAEPNTSADTVIYGPKDFHLTKDVNVFFLDDAGINFEGTISVNGIPFVGNPFEVIVPTGGDDVAMINAAAASVPPGGWLYFREGTYLAATDLNPFVDINILMSPNSRIRYTGVGNCVTIAPSNTNIPTKASITVERQFITPRWDIGTDTTSVGVLIKNSNYGFFNIQASGFHTGVILRGDGALGSCSYNTIFPVRVSENKRNLRFESVSGGWANQNVFLGGNLRISSGYASYADTHLIDLSTAGNGNTFIGTTLEANLHQYTFRIANSNNTFLNCRYEQNQAGSCEFMATSSANFVIGGYENFGPTDAKFNDISKWNTIMGGFGGSRHTNVGQGGNVGYETITTGHDTIAETFIGSVGGVYRRYADISGSGTYTVYVDKDVDPSPLVQIVGSGLTGRGIWFSYPGAGAGVTSGRLYGTNIGINIVGNIFWPADNVSDIGVGGARPRDILTGRNVNVGGAVNINGENGLGFISLIEQAADAAAPAANKAHVFAKDNGSGKTQLVVRFPTGATQVIATEP